MSDLEKDDASKPFSWRINLPHHSEQHMSVRSLSLHLGHMEVAKSSNENLFFKSALLTAMVSTRTQNKGKDSKP